MPITKPRPESQGAFPLVIGIMKIIPPAKLRPQASIITKTPIGILTTSYYFIFDTLIIPY